MYEWRKVGINERRNLEKNHDTKRSIYWNPKTVISANTWWSRPKHRAYSAAIFNTYVSLPIHLSQARSKYIRTCQSLAHTPCGVSKTISKTSERATARATVLAFSSLRCARNTTSHIAASYGATSYRAARAQGYTKLRACLRHGDVFAGDAYIYIYLHTLYVYIHTCKGLFQRALLYIIGDV